MKRVSLLLCLLLILGLFGGCSAGTQTDTATDGQPEVLNVYNWGVYMEIGEEDQSLDVNAAFEQWYKQTYGREITVNYTTYENNEVMYQKLVAGGAEYDIVIPSDYMIDRMIKEDLLEKLDFANIPNYQNIEEQFKDGSWQYDPTGEYSVPYMWGYLVLVYNTDHVDAAKVNKWDVLWDETYKGKILMFNNPRDTFAIALAKNGFSLNTKDAGEWEQAYQDLTVQKPLVQSYVTDEIFDKMQNGEAYIAPCYYGDFLVMQEEAADGVNLECGFIEGQTTNKYLDAMCVPKGCQNKFAAEAYINFMCSYEAGVTNANYTGYSSPLKNITDREDYDYADLPSLYPADTGHMEEYQYLGPGVQTVMDNYWKNLKQNEGSVWMYIVLVLVVLLVVGAVIYNKQVQKRRERLQKAAREKFSLQEKMAKKS